MIDGFAPDGYFNGTPYYIKTPTSREVYSYQMQLYQDLFGKPLELRKPTNPLRPYTPYPSKYYIDRRFDPPRPMTADDIYKAMEELKRRKTDETTESE